MTCTTPKIMLKVAFVTNVVPIYRYPVFEQLSQDAALRLQILVSVPLSESCSQAVANLPIKYSKSLLLSYTTNHTGTGSTQREPLSIPLAIIKDLAAFNPDVIVSGDLGIRSLMCWISAKILRARFVLWSEEIETSARGRSQLQQWLRGFLVRRADAALAWGAPARRYLETFGIPAKRIFSCAQAINNEYWVDQAEQLDRRSARAKLGLTGVVFLIVGRMLRLKGVQNFLNAWSLVGPELHVKSSVVIVGDGDYLTSLKDLAAEHGFHNVRFVGAKTPQDLASYYASADVFVFPSLVDVWGLVVNEAMCFGLPILASEFAGASQSLVASSAIGMMFNPMNIEEFAAHLSNWIDAPPAAAPRLCRQILEDVSFSKSTAAIQEMIFSLALPTAARDAS